MFWVRGEYHGQPLKHCAFCMIDAFIHNYWGWWMLQKWRLNEDWVCVLCIRRARTTTLTCLMIRFRMTLRRRRHSRPTAQVPTPAPHSRPTVPRSRPSGGARQRTRMRRTAMSMRTRDVQANLLTSLMIRCPEMENAGHVVVGTWKVPGAADF